MGSEYTLIAVISYVVIIAAISIVSLSLRRFNRGEFKDLIRTLLIALWFMIIPYGFMILRETLSLGPDQTGALGWAIYGSMTIVALYLLKTALLFYRFARVFGFGGGRE